MHFGLDTLDEHPRCGSSSSNNNKYSRQTLLRAVLVLKEKQLNLALPSLRFRNRRFSIHVLIAANKGRWIVSPDEASSGLTLTPLYRVADGYLLMIRFTTFKDCNIEASAVAPASNT